MHTTTLFLWLWRVVSLLAGWLAFRIVLDIRNSGPIDGRLDLQVESVTFESGHPTVKLDETVTRLSVQGMQQSLPLIVSGESSLEKPQYQIELRGIDCSSIEKWAEFLAVGGGCEVKIRSTVEQLNGRSKSKVISIFDNLTDLRRQSIQDWKTRIVHSQDQRETTALVDALDAVARMMPVE